MLRKLLPLAVFVVLAAFLFAGLQRDPRAVPSPLIGRAAPAFELPLLDAPERHFRVADMRGRVWVLNVWASWCAPCRDEHPVLFALAKSTGVPLVGLNYKDRPEDAMRWLRQLGDPYAFLIADPQGRIGIDWGVYGVPETYVIDAAGIIRFKHVGPITGELVEKRIAPLVRELGRS